MKKLLGFFMSTAVLVCVAMGCTAPAAPPLPAPEASATQAPAAPAAPAAGKYDLSGKKIGVTFYDLTNPIWAATGENIIKFGNELGAEVTLVSCEGNAATQISQIENMISAIAETALRTFAKTSKITALIKTAALPNTAPPIKT